MEAVKISPKFQVVIPRNVREAMKLIPGQKIQVIQYEDRIELIPERKISGIKRFLTNCCYYTDFSWWFTTGILLLHQHEN
ncbi:AbrB/MazE/SpoVT family DNA-binding domain-containing protein [bacterium]|nr:AbrB/MazE/SpoVT family DNA-binding domain-containing protein [bacterium]